MEESILLNKDYFSDDQYIISKYDVESRDLKMHSHEFWEISYVYEGKGMSCFGNDITEPIAPGEFVFISPGAIHCIQSPPSDKGAWVRVCNLLVRNEYIDMIINDLILSYGFDEYLLPKMISEHQPFCIHFEDHSRIVLNMLTSAAHECKFPSQASETVIKNLATNIFIYITRFYEEMVNKNKITATEYDVIDDLINHVKSNYGRNLSLDYLSAYTHLSALYLSRYFKKCTGMKLSDYITKVRIERAKSLLRSSEHTVQDISLFCGYNNISNFHKSFKKYTNMTASEYRASKKR